MRLDNEYCPVGTKLRVTDAAHASHAASLREPRSLLLAACQLSSGPFAPQRTAAVHLYDSRGPCCRYIRLSPVECRGEQGQNVRTFLLGEAAVDEFNKGSSLQAFEEEVRLASTSSRERGVLLDKSVTAFHDFIDAGPESQHGSSLAAVQAPAMHGLL